MKNNEYDVLIEEISDDENKMDARLHMKMKFNSHSLQENIKSLFIHMKKDMDCKDVIKKYNLCGRGNINIYTGNLTSAQIKELEKEPCVSHIKMSTKLRPASKK